MLGRFEVAVRWVLEQVAAEAALCVGLERARVHRLFAQERLRQACAFVLWVSKCIAELNKGDAYLKELACLVVARNYVKAGSRTRLAEEGVPEAGEGCCDASVEGGNS